MVTKKTEPHETIIANHDDSDAGAIPGNAARMTFPQFTQWCEAVLDEVPRISEAARAKLAPIGTSDMALAYGGWSDITGAVSPGANLETRRTAVQEAHRRLADEPYIIRAEISTRGDRKVYAVARSSPAGVIVNGVVLVHARSPVGIALRSIEPGEVAEIEIGNRVETIELLVRAEVNPKAVESRVEDAAVASGDLATRSAREWTRLVASSDAPDGQFGASGRSVSLGSDRRRSFELYDQRSLYKAQRDVLQSAFRRPLKLVGPAGTGKTTAIVKRINDVLSLALEDDEELQQRRVEIEIDRAIKSGCPVRKWVMVVPHPDWVRYVGAAFLKEGGIRVRSQEVRTCRDLFSELRQRILGGSMDGPETRVDPAAVIDIELKAPEIVASLDSGLVQALRAALEALERAGIATQVSVESLGRDVPIEAVSTAVRRVLSDTSLITLPDAVNVDLDRLSTALASGEDSASISRAVRKLCVALARGSRSRGQEQLLGQLQAAGHDRGALESTGRRVLAANAVRSLIRTEADWLSGARTHRVLGADHSLSESILSDITLLVTLRNTRIAQRSADALGLAKYLPEVVGQRQDILFGHVYVDEFENRSLVELTVLALLCHASADSVVFSGDPEQATENAGHDADLRLAMALQLGRLGPAQLVPFERRVRQTSRLAAVCDTLRRDRDRSLVAIKPEDPEIVLKPHLDDSSASGWVRTMLEMIQATSGTAVTAAVVLPSSVLRSKLAKELAAEPSLRSLGLEVVELDEVRRPSSSKPAVYLASIDGPHLLHGLEFEGVVLVGVDQMLDGPLGRKRTYVAMTRAARFLAVSSGVEIPDELRLVESFAKGPRWQ
jgi:hypothetical protein